MTMIEEYATFLGEHFGKLDATLNAAEREDGSLLVKTKVTLTNDGKSHVSLELPVVVLRDGEDGSGDPEFLAAVENAKRMVAPLLQEKPVEEQLGELQKAAVNLPESHMNASWWMEEFDLTESEIAETQEKDRILLRSLLEQQGWKFVQIGDEEEHEHWAFVKPNDGVEDYP